MPKSEIPVTKLHRFKARSRAAGETLSGASNENENGNENGNEAGEDTYAGALRAPRAGSPDFVSVFVFV